MPGRSASISKARLKQLVEEATVDAYGESEQATALFTVLEEHPQLPFETQVLGVKVTVAKVDLTGDDDIVAICRRGQERQKIRIVDLPRPDPLPDGWEWVEAYRHWARGWKA